MVLGLALVGVPFAALADTTQDVLDSARFMMTRQAAISSGFDITKPSCFVTASKSNVRIGESFVLAWGSYGIDTANAMNGWAQNGAQYMALSSPGLYNYKYTFYGPFGTIATCSKVVIAS